MPVLVTVSVRVVVCGGVACVSLRLSGETSMFGSPPPPDGQAQATTSSTHQPVAPTEVSEPRRQRICTVCPARGRRFTTTRAKPAPAGMLPVQAGLPASGLLKAELMTPLYPPTVIFELRSVQLLPPSVVTSRTPPS
ncbi:MAG: hypothetical protein BWY91_01143 [bacterium ADurb.BinA028]|nr:MAG: hypothetical protein BWY91_01143 [bacterium ADurb.BinA028]